MKRQLIPFLTEWLVNHGTNPVLYTDVASAANPLLFTAARMGYVAFNQHDYISKPATVTLTKKGIRYLKEN